MFHRTALTIAVYSSLTVTGEAHGYLKTPRSKNWAAFDDISKCTSDNCPAPEYCHHCLNTNTGVCGKSPTHNYEYGEWKDRAGNPMAWASQATYIEGQYIDVTTFLDTHHNGHHEFRACVVQNEATDCLKQEDFGKIEEGADPHLLEYIADYNIGGDGATVPDPNYWWRGMYSGGQAGATKEFKHKFKLPDGIYGEKVLLQWKYITANSCSPPGYGDYFATHSSYPASWWTQGLGPCAPPYPQDGSRSTTDPEQFFNCAEVTILQSGTPPPNVSPKPTPQPTTAKPTIVGGPQCLARFADCTGSPNGCCEDLACRQVDAAGSSKCLDTCTDGPPSPPTYSPPTIPPTNGNNPPATNPPTNPQPTPPPPTPGKGCCSRDLGTCTHLGDAFCNANKENCEGPCGKHWLDNGDISDTCSPLWTTCSADSDCCLWSHCSAGECDHDGTWKPPVGSPQPTSPPVLPSPTPPPTPNPTSPVSSGGYCNWNGCNGAVEGGPWCNENSGRCTNGCGGTWCSGGGGPPPTPKPVLPSPTPPPTPNPTSPVSSGGYCNWNGCNGAVEGGPWCNENSGHCTNGCGGTWCSGGGGPPPTPKPTPQPVNVPSPTPPTTDGFQDGLVMTHYWDCSGQSCDATTLQPWNMDKYRSAKGYQPQDPANFGGAVYGEKMWLTAAIMNIDMGPSDSCCGELDSGEGGCGNCVLVQNPDSINPDWTALVMKKNTCGSCVSGPHIDVNVPGFDVLQYSLANICGADGTGLTKDESTTLGQWYNTYQNTKQAQVLCDRLPLEYQEGCQLFTEWGWTTGNPQNAKYKVVECPQAYKDFIASQFDKDGITAAGLP